MNPGSKVTWPQYVAEMVIYWRTQFIKDYKDIQRGQDWHKTIQKPVRDLNQQAAVICNYFEHPNKEPLVAVAFRNFFRKTKPMKIGQFRKVRFTEKNGRRVSNITQDEKDVVTGINAELNRLIIQRDMFIAATPKSKDPLKSQEEIKFKTTGSSKKKGGLGNILALEQQLKKDN
jgi:hypothetical protein